MPYVKAGQRMDWVKLLVTNAKQHSFALRVRSVSGGGCMILLLSAEVGRRIKVILAIATRQQLPTLKYGYALSTVS